jgi:predicted enzyme related to lactoylglutathione lyase
MFATTHAAGSFSSADLSTRDLLASKAFYLALFDWEIEDLPIGGGVCMMRVGGRLAAELYVPFPALDLAGVPLRWNAYVTVDDAQATVDTAVALGATVLLAPMRILDHGRLVILRDPGGAVLGLWEPDQTRGVELLDAPGALAWNDLRTPDVAAGVAFYAALFGWTAEPAGAADPVRRMRTPAGGRVSIRGAGAGLPAEWLPALGVGDLDAAVAAATGLGARVLEPTIDVGLGRLTVLHDPQGTAFALFGGRFDD